MTRSCYNNSSRPYGKIRELQTDVVSSRTTDAGLLNSHTTERQLLRLITLITVIIITE